MENKSGLPLIFLLSIVAFSFFISCNSESTSTQEDPAEEVWLSLFNGKDLNDWTPKFAGHTLKTNYRNSFTMVDNNLSVRYSPKDTFEGAFGHLFYKDKFSHYKLRATYRFVGDQLTGGPGWAFRNNGLMLHCQAPETMGLQQGFPVCLEMQLLGGNGKDERSTGNLCSPSTHVIMHDTLFTQHCVNSTSKTYHGDQWVTVDVLVLGDSLIQHIVEDKVVMEYKKSIIGGIEDHVAESFKAGTPIKEGYISIQAETHGIDFKAIDLLDLCGCMDKKAKNYKSYFIQSTPSKCKY